MRIKSFLILVYGTAGLFIASITAFMTFLIIEEPIGYKMGSKIVLTVVLTTPVVILISAVTGGLFARHINAIAERLEKIAEGEYGTDLSGSAIKELATINDVSNRLSQEISTLLGSLKARNEELSMMLLTFSHDVRTPLMIANGYIEELEDNLVPSERLPAVYEKLKNENNYINELCNDILTYQHSREKESRVNDAILVQPIADEVIALLDAPIVNAVDPSISFAFNVIDLKKVLINLLQNALKYAQSEEIKIYSQDAEIIVEDSGIGIEPVHHSKIFEPFYTVDSSKNRVHSGFGLGLAITKNLCRRNQCLIQYDAGYERGARFILSKSSTS
ncbi:HAMP domain-containing sensor histidine kinase [Sulfurimonas sp. HSL3-7]|uniref:sensor histidine kinase n=1 Tax=Sulfonitrofixus jiaomeiensis TaxID=3131938 RepID=UPI0031F83D3B